MKKEFFAWGMTFLMVAGFCCGAAEGVVTASRLNARVFPELKSPAAVLLPRGKKVEIFKRHGAWLEIAAPDITPVFASAAYLHGNKVIRDMNLRIQPALKAAVLARVTKGTVLRAVSDPDRYGWVQVAPLPEMRLYVMRDYVSFDASKVPVAPYAATPFRNEAAAPEQKAAPAPEKKAEAAPAAPAEKKAAPAPAPEKKAEAAPAPAPEKKAAPAPAAPVEKKAVPAPEKKAEPVKKAEPAAVKKAEKAPFELAPARKRELINIGADITRNSAFSKQGRLVAVPTPSGDCTAFALVGAVDGAPQGFVFAEAPIDLKSMLDKVVDVQGFAYKVGDWRNPVVAVTQIKVIGE